MLALIRGQVQNYDWGRVGSASSVARLWAASSGEPIDEVKPYAELWLGTHPSGPARLAVDARLVRDYLGDELPFLLKNLSVNKALSIQAHPNKSLAAQLHASAPQHYKDANHKPEMTIALGDFQCMCGFRPLGDIAACLSGVPELRALVGDEQCIVLEQLVASGVDADAPSAKAALRAVFAAVMRCANVDQYLQPLLARIRLVPLSLDLLPSVAVAVAADSGSSVHIDLTELLLRLSSQYPSDIGCFAPFFLNTFTLRAGEAIFLGPNLPHAYLHGDCIEAMACSDNVVRAGLTPKFRDVEVLCEMLTYQTGPPDVMRGVAIDAFSTIYSPPAASDVDEFEVTHTLVPASTAYVLPPVHGASVLLVCNGGGYAISAAVDIVQAERIPLSVGASVLVPSGTSVQLHATGDQRLQVFRCSARQAPSAASRL